MLVKLDVSFQQLWVTAWLQHVTTYVIPSPTFYPWWIVFFCERGDGIMMDYVLEANPLVDYRWWCPSSLANLLHITPISPWFMVDVS